MTNFCISMRCPMKSFLLKIAVGIEQISGVGLEDTFSLRWRAVPYIMNIMIMKLFLLLSCVHLLPVPVFAQETQADSTCVDRPTFSMTPT